MTPTRPQADSAPRCTDARAPRSGSVSLPVLAGEPKTGGIRPSRNGPRRAIVLAIIQLLIIAHIVQWVIMGTTTTPVEPSEAMDFTKYGVINAGFILFSIALLSTLIMGRWFCGWGCHVVMLQDLCGWMMKKVGVRPKPFRSRLLIYVPLILALYMFIWPAVYRWGLVPLDAWAAARYGTDHTLVAGMRSAAQVIGVPLGVSIPEWKVSTELTTSEFWKTFPGVMVAIPFLLICGFACVYFLGAKGFCTYGCPYGGFFAPLDKFSPARIRVTDACEGCGHCTAVCTSNVRVHEEVREYGMVVDPGCMKCLDCVSVCPKEALYFGFGAPAVARGAPKHEAPARRYDMGWTEEFVFSLVFLLTFLAYRGVYVGLIPVLMAVGMAGIVTFLAWKLWRMMRDANVNFHRWRLRYHGGMTRAGAVFATLAALALLLTAHSGVVRAAQAVGTYYDDRVHIHPVLVFLNEHDPAVMEPLSEDARRAIAAYRMVLSVNRGGIGLIAFNQSELDARLSWLHSVRGEFDEAERLTRRALERDGRSERFCSGLAMLLLAQDRFDEALAYAADVLREETDYLTLLGDFIAWCDDLRRIDLAIEVCEARLKRKADDVPTMTWLARLRLQAGQFEAGIAILQQAIQAEPQNPLPPSILALVHLQRGMLDEAHAVLDAALRENPENAGLIDQMGTTLEMMGRLDEARQHYRRAAELRSR